MSPILLKSTLAYQDRHLAEILDLVEPYLHDDPADLVATGLDVEVNSGKSHFVYRGLDAGD